jgi:hypothetical protein
MCKNISGPPLSSLMKPKPRSAFHIFSLPAAILFSLFQPQLDQAAECGRAHGIVGRGPSPIVDAVSIAKRMVRSAYRLVARTEEISPGTVLVI